MAEFRSLLPTWVNWGATISAAPLYLALGLLSMTLARRFCRPPSASAHWTERARQSSEDQSLLVFTSLVSVLFAAGFTWLTVSGVLAPGQRLTRAAIVVVLLGLFGSRQQKRYRNLVAPGEDLVPTWQERIFSLLMNWMPVLLAFALAVWAPAEWGPRLILMQTGGLALMVLLGMGWGLTVCRGLGVLRPADESLAARVREAGLAARIEPIRALVLPAGRAQAYALGWCRTVVVTTGLLQHLREDQVRSIIDHEVGHLKEPLVDRLGRLRALVFLAAVAMWRFLVASIGWWGFAAVLILGWWLVVLALKRSRELETHADDHATEQAHSDSTEQEERVHSRALERIHEVNLAPAVTPSQLSTHPCLFDRMETCGLTPDYPRPAPLGFSMRSYLLATVPCAVLMAFVTIGAYGLSSDARQSESAALGAIVLRGGHPVDIEALAHAWRDESPEHAQVAQDAADAYPDIPGGLPPGLVRWFMD